MPLNLAIAPVPAPTLTGVTVTATLKGILIAWDALQDQTLFAVEIWVSSTNNRAAATLLTTVTGNYYLHAGLASNAALYYWVRAKNTFNRTDGAWTPLSATAGATTTTLLAQTADLNANAVTSVSLYQNSTDITQTVYDTWEPIMRHRFRGTGNAFVLDTQIMDGIQIATMGTSQSAYSSVRMELFEHTAYEVGTISVTNGSAIVTGTGTAWVGAVAVGNVLTTIPDGVDYTIQSVDSNGQITLTTPYTGATASSQLYYIVTSSILESIIETTTKSLQFIGGYCITSAFPFAYRFPFISIFGKIYEHRLSWALFRDNATWSIQQTVTLRTLILEEVKR